MILYDYRCVGCAHMRPGQPCLIYQLVEDTACKWSAGPCPMATHFKPKAEKVIKQMDPLKASKRRAAGKG